MSRRVQLALSACLAALVVLRLHERFGRQLMREAWLFGPFVFLVVFFSFALPTRRSHFVLSIAVFLVIQNVYFFDAVNGPQLLISGKSSVCLSCWLTQESSLSKFKDLVTIYAVVGPSQERRKHVDFEVRRHELSLNMVEGLRFPPGATFEQRLVTFTETMHNTLNLINSSCSTPWVLILEDDAVFHMDFIRQALCLMDNHQVDLYQLDARAATERNLNGVPFGGNVGLLYRMDVIPRLIPWFNVTGPLFQEFTSIHPELEGSYDRVLNHLCFHDKKFRCIVRPLVSEVGFFTSVRF